MENQGYKDKNNMIVVVGGGSIGVSFSLLFAKSLINIQLYEPDEVRVSDIYEELELRLNDLVKYDLLDHPKGEVLKKIQVISSLEKADKKAELVIECAPENLSLKKEVFSELELFFSKDTILASASSAITMSEISQDLIYKSRCLIAHPGNPPHLIPIVELVATGFTEPKVIEKVRSIFQEVGQIPVLINKEIKGFVFNRLQGAILREAYCLVRDEIASVEDIDSIVKDGLGLRWSIMGPFETVDLNTRGGIISHAEKMGSSYEDMGKERGQIDTWGADLVAEVNRQRRKILPLIDWDERVLWRDESLMKLLRDRKKNKV